MVLGVGDTRLGTAVQEVLEIQCQSGGVVLEVLRGIDSLSDSVLSRDSISFSCCWYCTSTRQVTHCSGVRM